MKKGLVLFSGFFAFIIITLFSSQHASADVIGTDSVINGLITQQQINQTQKPQFADRNGSSEAIDPTSGSLTWKQNNIHLPGREGLDLDIGIMYQSNYSFGYMRYYNTPGNIKKYNYLISRYDLGLGWSFRLPSVQFQDSYIYYHNGEGAIYQVDFNAAGTAESYTHLLGYQGKDLKFAQDTAGTFSNGQVGSVSAYYLEYASKKREYFAVDGRLLGIVDRYGNKITFTYQDRQTYDGQTNKVIDTITDTVGRTVKFTYDTNLQTATDDNFNGENIVVSVKDPSQIISQTVTYTKWRGKMTFNGNPDGYAPSLWNVQNQVGDFAYFKYAKDSNNNSLTGKFDYYKKSFDSYSGFNSFMLLNDVSFPSSQTNYQYENVTRNLGTSGISEEFRITSRNDQLKKYDSTINNYIYYGDNNRMNYTYSGDYTGFPTHYDPNNISSTFAFSSTSTLQSTTPTNGMQTISTFNGLKQPISSETKTSNGERKVSTNLTFHSTFKYIPTSIQIADYAVGDTDATANKLFVNKNYTDWGGLQSVTQPLNQTQLNDASTQRKYTTTQVYEPTYNQLQSKSWYQNVGDFTALSESYAYDSNGRVITSTNAKGEVSKNCYDVMDVGGIVTSSCLGATTPLTGKVQKITTTKDLINGKTAKTIIIFGSDTNYAYPSETSTYFSTTNDSGQPSTQIIKQTMIYDMGFGLLKDTIDGNNNKTSNVYDLLGRITEVKYPKFTNLSGVQYDVSDKYEYTRGFSSLSDSVNAGISNFIVHSYRKYTKISNSVITLLNNRYDYYDGMGNLRSEYYDSSGSWKFAHYDFDDIGRVIYSIDSMENTSTAKYDVWGRQSETVDAYGNLYETNYNIKTRKTIQYFVDNANVNAFRANPNQNNLKSNYVEQDSDQWGNVLTNRAYKDLNQTQPITESYTYNISGQVITYTDPNKNMNNDGITTKYSYDVLGRLISAKDALNQLTNYQYNDTGNIQQVSVQSSPTATPIILNTKQFNEIGELTTKTDPSSLSKVMTYNNLGLVNKNVDRNGTIFTSQYDEQNRRTISSIANNGITLSSKTNIGSNGIMYDELQNYTNNTLTGSKQTGIDNLKRITSITTSATNYSSSLGLIYDSNSRLIKQTNNLSAFNVNYHYDKQRMDMVQLDGQSVINSASSANAVYDYYSNGQVKSITYPALTDGTVLKTTNTYDVLNRLTNVTNTKGATVLSSYDYTSYDDNGNILSKKDKVNQVSQTSTYTYDKLNRLLTILKPDGSLTSYTYDLKGNRSTLQESTLINFSLVDTTNTYDLLNRLSSVTKGTATTTFAYDQNNLRYKKTNGAKTVHFQYNSAGQVISESNGTNVVTANYIRGDRLLAKKDVSTSKMYYYLYNGHGDVVQIVNTAGEVVNQYQYDDWGNIVSQFEDPTKFTSNSFMYAGEQYDEETGLYYLRARFYDPSIGRFINEDTYEGQINNPLSLNLYTYVHNNPLTNVDPTGHWCTSADGKYSHAGGCNDGAGGKQRFSGAGYVDDATYAKGQLVNLFVADFGITKQAYSMIFNDPLSALIDNKTGINLSGSLLGVSSTVIGAVIFREQATQKPPDAVANGLSYVTGKQHSVGLGAIFPSTARSAWDSYGGGDMLPKSNYDLQKKLSSDDQFNIASIALVLINKASTNKIDVSAGTTEQWASVTPYYNSSMSTAKTIESGNHYGGEITKYLPWIEILLK